MTIKIEIPSDEIMIRAAIEYLKSRIEEAAVLTPATTDIATDITPPTDAVTDIPLPPTDTVDIPLPPADEKPDTSSLDAEGIPWDKRIHSSGKTRMKSNDTWKLKKGTDPIMVAQVKTELHQKHNGPVEGSDLKPIDFPSLMVKISEAKIPGESVGKVISDLGLSNIGDLAAPEREVLLPTVLKMLNLE